uniref:Putative secreted protein n=1 Tax=Anopheles darlingi TaxID=43151 RepID=A0A2M4DJ88_ANODA
MPIMLLSVGLFIVRSWASVGRPSIISVGCSSEQSDWFEPSAVTSHETTFPLKHGSIVASSAISSFTTPKSASIDLKKYL